MCRAYEVGKYNVDFEGGCYDEKTPYTMVIFEEFGEDNKPVNGTRKTLYFRNERNYIVPRFGTEAEVEQFLHYKNNQKLEVINQKIVYEIKLK